MARCSRLPCRHQVCGPLMGEQADDGLDDVAHALAAAEMAGQSPPVLGMGDAVLDPGASRGVRFLRCWSRISSYQSGAFLLNLRCGGVTTRPPPPGPGSRHRRGSPLRARPTPGPPGPRPHRLEDRPRRTPRLPHPATVDPRAVRGLKFSAALPIRIATTTLTERLADFDSALAVTREPVRVKWGA